MKVISALKITFEHQLYTMFHPIEGFYDMRYEKKGRISQIIVNVILFWISFSFIKQYAGFMVNETYPLSYNLLGDLASILLVFILFSAANWSVTTLTDGEGRFVDIIMVVSYSLLPMILTFIPAALFSRLITAEEAGFYGMALGISIAWFLMLLFFGILTIHNYTVGKTIATFFITFVSIVIILFLTVMVISLLQQVVVFLRSIYIEMLFRT